MAALLVLLLVGGCGNGEAATLASKCQKPEGAPASPPAGATTCTLEARLEVSVKGSQSVRDNADREVVIVQFYGESLPKASWLFGMQQPGPVELDELQYRVGFLIGPGTYEGPRDYELSNPGETQQHEAFFEVIRDEGFVRYDRMERGCRVELEAEGTSGSLSCPKLAAAEGSVSIEVRWEAV